MRQTNDWYPNAIRCTTPWQDTGSTYGRVWPQTVTLAVQHHTAGTVNSTIQTFGPNSSRQVSAHFLVGRNGKVYQFVALSNIAWHAGSWEINVKSIGIEHEQYRPPNSDSSPALNWTTWTDIQLDESARLQTWLSTQMQSYDMQPHSAFSLTDCPGDLPIADIQRRMQLMATTPSTFKDPLTGLTLYGGMAARWYQLLDKLGPEIYMVIGHVTREEADGTDSTGKPDGSRIVLFEHQIWRWRPGQSPERFDILADITNPYIQT